MIWLVGIIIGCLSTIIVTPLLIKWFTKIKISQLVIRENEYGPNHSFKAGTPTMGGAGFILVILVGYFIISTILNVQNTTGTVSIITILIYAIVGGFDDSIKIWNHRDEGFRFIPKLIAQIVAAIIAIIILYIGKFNFVLSGPFGIIKSDNIIIFTIFTIIWLVGWSNATNLTDGLDGLASGSAVISYISYAIISYTQGNTSLLLLNSLIIGSLLGFLLFNKYPAKIFMGDTGSLALGAGLAINSLVLHVEWSLILIGFVYMIETVTVIIQIFYYRLTGKRFFLMTPIHHSFEKGGLTGNINKPWSEWKVDSLFWTVGIITNILYFTI